LNSSREGIEMKNQQYGMAQLHPLAWAVGIAVILFSAVGVGAFMGWIPTSMTASESVDKAADKAALEKQAASTAEKTGFPEKTAKHISAAPAKPAPMASERAKAPTRTSTRSTTAADAPVPVVPPNTVTSGSTATPRCAECGVVASVRDVQTKGTGSGLGAVGGAVLGGVLGNQVGGGRGQDVATVVGAVGGGLAGNEVEKRVKSTRSRVVTIRFDDGSTRDVDVAADSAWRAGDKVKLVDGVIRTNG